MLGTAVIVFREVLEAALIIGIVTAATRNVPGRGRWITGGLLIGLAGACVVAALTDVIAQMAEGVGQEIFNATILAIAVGMLAWHNIWMSAHAAEMSARAKAMGVAVSGGLRECSALLLIVGLAVLREGSETVLFLHGIAAADGGAAAPLLIGGGLGALAGALTGYATYFGLLRIPLRWFFNATAALVLMLAAGLAAQAAGFLIQADLIPGPSTPLWDTSRTLPEDSIAGALLHGLIGYQARPSAMQIGCYAITLIAIGFGMRWSGKSRSNGNRV
jgi:high-affinity iron transporter